ncbi:hypothetical protein CR194_02750 [Salipaludibacillus keqinensis]|uniref:Peptidylprolyl isomerase n=1 Tax=Salipaludibacillus keqinensis TaxID=2045207 RepID=A0A323TI66_9BACI|nr:SurA N-terminal domain-containing protein [Salipaludibacillus keqinensis]PYZ94469.1 hypothetical protein CR194_02750 [Salipaludibacillus keqinensis]
MKRFNRKALLALPLSAALVLAACGDDNNENGNSNNEEGAVNQENSVNNDDTETDNNTETDSNENIAMNGEQDMESDPDETIATVNGEEIVMADMQAQMAQFEQMIAQSGGEMEDEETAEILMQMQQQVLDNLINQEVLTQKADELDINVDEEEIEEAVDAELEQIKAQFEDEEQLEEILEAENTSMEEIEEDIREFYTESMKIEELLTLNHVDEDELSVSEEEVRERYDQMAMQNPEIGEFEDMEDELEEEVKEQKYVEQLREEADIEILI